MSTDSPETHKGGHSFQIHDYDYGFFDPSGNRIDTPLSERGLKDWEQINSEFDYKLFGIGQKLQLPDSPNPGQRILFGRDSNTVDVVIDSDVIDDYVRREQGVSRQQFEILNSSDGRWEIQDLGSTNGTLIFKKDTTIDLKKRLEPYYLQDGDTIIVGGSSGLYGRLIGFRYHDSPDEKPYLIKFNAKSADEIASGTGIYKSRPDLLGKLPEKDVKGPIKEIENYGMELVGMQLEVLDLRGKDRNKFNKRSLEYQRRQLDIFERLGRLHYQGDWGIAASEVGQWAHEKGVKMLEETKGDKKVNSKIAKGYLALATNAMELGAKNSPKSTK
jgi:hypothetical protein